MQEIKEFWTSTLILGVVYSKENMEKTEPLVSRKFYENSVNLARIESNNGGRGFARNIERILREKYNSNHTVIKWFSQNKNKKARILSNSTWVMEHIYFPKNWENRWQEFSKALLSYQKEGKNKHDDAPDALTGVAENINKRGFKWNL